MKTSVVFALPDLGSTVQLAQVAEAAGYDRVWTTENPGRDAIVRALAVGLSTHHIEVATGIAYAFTRAPLALAATAADAYQATAGRFSLGLGAGTKGMRARWYGIEDFVPPATRLSEYASLMRSAWSAESEFDFQGQFYRGHYDQLDGSRPQVPLWGSGVNRAMLTVSARHFDGVAVHALASAVTYLDTIVLPAVADGSAGRLLPPQVAVWRMASVDQDGEVARQRARRALAFYFSTPSYGVVADVTGWGDVAQRLRHEFLRDGPRWQELGALIPSEMLRDFCLAGTAEEVREHWSALAPLLQERGVDEIVLQTVAVDAGAAEVHQSVDLLLQALSPTSVTVP